MNGTCAGGTERHRPDGPPVGNESVELIVGAQTETVMPSFPFAASCQNVMSGFLSRGVSLPEVARSVRKRLYCRRCASRFGRRIEGPLAFLGGPFNYLPTQKRCSPITETEDRMLRP
jgi:hypothetical protein